MTKIAFIGAGSLGFTRKLITDVLTYPLLQDATLALMDIDAERLDFAEQSAKKIVAAGRYPATVMATMERAEALEGANAVLVTILVGDTNVWRHDIEIPKKYGVDINVGDTRGPSGIFRALRTIPVLLDIAHDMERYCPDATMLNYTNPMAMLCRAVQRESPIRLTGLCHSVQGTAKMLARWIGAPDHEISYTCAGINHNAWYTRFEWNGRDAYPLIRQAITERPEVYNEEIVRNEMFLHLDHYVTESSGHSSEYNWWFRKRPDLIEQYCTHGTGWNPGVYAYILKEYQAAEDSWRYAAREWLAQKDVDLARGHEYAAAIINALEGGEPFRYHGNVPNTGLITNLPQGACVEVPVWASKDGLEPVYVGALPPQCAALTGINAQVEEMAVEGALRGDARLVFHAIANDPLTAAVLSLAEIEEMVDEMFRQNAAYLPQFRHPGA
ncbi:MAG TPA: alpha-galactosidase [Anaerolineae bacterium]|nr:alpha-galactosidase [Anaerolineae bacterium]HOQ98562.1 alpha-galactosidase [Anaerolineae bacterium]HPL28419.1 alpha-galactosidase [Anaerolineae bacterium]